MFFPLPGSEPSRLDALKCLNFLDAPPERKFNELTRLAALVCGAPIPLVSLVNAKRNWFKSKVGLDVEQIPREGFFCSCAVNQKNCSSSRTRPKTRFAVNTLVKKTNRISDFTPTRRSSFGIWRKPFRCAMLTKTSSNGSARTPTFTSENSPTKP